jgi:hypothetical protein
LNLLYYTAEAAAAKLKRREESLIFLIKSLNLLAKLLGLQAKTSIRIIIQESYTVLGKEL